MNAKLISIPMESYESLLEFRTRAEKAEAELAECETDRDRYAREANKAEAELAASWEELATARKRIEKLENRIRIALPWISIADHNTFEFLRAVLDEPERVTIAGADKEKDERGILKPAESWTDVERKLDSLSGTDKEKEPKE